MPSNCLPTHCLHEVLWITLAFDLDVGGSALNLRKIVCRDLDLSRTNVFLKPMRLGRSKPIPRKL